MREAILISSSPLASPVRAKFFTKQIVIGDEDFDFDAAHNRITNARQIVVEKTQALAVKQATRTASRSRSPALGLGSEYGRSPKRRRLSPPTVYKPAMSKSKALEILELSSDLEDELPRIESSTQHNKHNNIVDYSEDELPELNKMSVQMPLRSPKSSQRVHTNIYDLSSEIGSISGDIDKPGRRADVDTWSFTDSTSSRSKDSHKSTTSSTSTFAGYKRTKPNYSSRNKAEQEDPIIDSSQPVPVITKCKTSVEKAAEKEEKERQKQAKKAGKEKEKEQKKLDKQLASDVAEVNRRKTDRKVTACEMTIEMPSSLQGKAVGNQVKLFLDEAGAQTRFYEETVNLTGDTSRQLVGKIIHWRRRVKSEWDDQADEWKLLTQAKTTTEPHVLIYITGEQYCKIAAGGPYDSNEANGLNVADEDRLLENFDSYITLIRSKYPDVGLVLLVEGLFSFIKKISNSKNRDYQESVRQQLVDEELTISDPPTQSSSSNRTSKKRKPATSSVDVSFFNSDLAETIDVHLQLEHQPLQIHHTTSVANSAKQIDAFTQHLSTRPYRNQELEHNMKHASFSMATGQVKTGQGDKKETWIKMLEQVNRITVCLAHGVHNAGYESPMELVNGFKSLEGDSQGDEARQDKERARLMLEDVKKAANRFGADSDKRLGPMVSKRLYKVFMSTDENLRDGIA